MQYRKRYIMEEFKDVLVGSASVLFRQYNGSQGMTEVLPPGTKKLLQLLYVYASHFFSAHPSTCNDTHRAAAVEALNDYVARAQHDVRCLCYLHSPHASTSPQGLTSLLTPNLHQLWCCLPTEERHCGLAINASEAFMERAVQEMKGSAVGSKGLVKAAHKMAANALAQLEEELQQPVQAPSGDERLRVDPGAGGVVLKGTETRLGMLDSLMLDAHSNEAMFEALPAGVVHNTSFCVLHTEGHVCMRTLAGCGHLSTPSTGAAGRKAQGRPGHAHQGRVGAHQI